MPWTGPPSGATATSSSGRGSITTSGPNETIDLLPHQEALLLLFASPKADGTRWRNQVYSTIKKSGKTAIAAILTRYEVERGPGGREIYLAANDRDQATNRVFDAIRKSINWDPEAQGSWNITGHELRHSNGTFIKAIASDFRGEAGANPSLTAWTELWGFDTEGLLRFYEEMTPVPTTESIRLVETSTGYEGQSDLLRDLYETGMAGRQLTAGELDALTGCGLDAFKEASGPHDRVPIWLNDRANMVMYWDEGLVARRMPWQQGTAGEEYYREQEQTLRPSQYKRLHLNQWTQAEEAYIDIRLWDALAADVPALDPKERLVLGIDAAARNDTFAIVGVTRHWDPARAKDTVAVRWWGVWEAPPGGAIDFNEPLEEIAELVKNYGVAVVVYDPTDMSKFAQDLRTVTRHRVFVDKFEQRADRLRADKRLYDMIQGGNIVHCNPPEIRQHLLNSNVKLDQDDRMRILKRSTRIPVDLVVAMSMAVDRCMKWSFTSPF